MLTITVNEAMKKANGKPIFNVYAKEAKLPSSLFSKYPILEELLNAEFILVHTAESVRKSHRTFSIHGASGATIVEKTKTKDIKSRNFVLMLIESLEKCKRTVPKYLSDIKKSTEPELEQITFAMYCFWSGERNLGSLDGVVATRAGFHHFHEVVEVTFNPTILPIGKLIKHAIKNQNGDIIYIHKKSQEKEANKSAQGKKVVSSINSMAVSAPSKDQKYQLKHSNFKNIKNLTTYQKTKLNAFCNSSSRSTLTDYLSPKQRKDIV